MKPLNLDDLQLIAEVTDFMPNCRQFTTEQIDGTWYALFESEDEILEVPLTLIDGCTLAPETQLELVAELRNDPGFVIFTNDVTRSPQVNDGWWSSDAQAIIESVAVHLLDREPQLVAV